MFQPRPYQIEAIKANVGFFQNAIKKTEHGIEILPTGSGKSIVIANTAKELEGNTLIFQPSKEILEQNFAKYISYGFNAAIYSASAGQKRIGKVTFATIGSVAAKHHLFKEFNNIIIDECHLVNSKDGMYHDFIHSLEDVKVLGLTATPYRLSSGMEGAELKFLTRTRPRIFSKVIYYVQNSTLFSAGHLAPLKYFSFNVIDRRMLQVNSTGADFTAESLRRHLKSIDMPKITIDYALRLLQKRKNLLIFCSLIEEAETVAKGIPGAIVITGSHSKADRERILSHFKTGKIRCLVNVGVLTTGFDYPALECILLARSTMSLSLYYQMIGRCIRPFKYPDGSIKEGWVVDLGGNINMFGKVEDLKIVTDSKGLFSVINQSTGRQLTNVPFAKN